MSLNDEMARQTNERNTNDLIDGLRDRIAKLEAERDEAINCHPADGISFCGGCTTCLSKAIAELEADRDRLRLENRSLRDQIAEHTSRCEGLEAERDHYRAIVGGGAHDMVVCGSQPEEAFEARNTWDDGSLATFTSEVDDTVPAPPPVEIARVCTGRCIGRAWQYLPCQSGAAVECQQCGRMINGGAISEQDWEDGVDRCANGCVWHLCQG